MRGGVVYIGTGQIKISRIPDYHNRSSVLRWYPLRSDSRWGRAWPARCSGSPGRAEHYNCWPLPQRCWSREPPAA